MDCCGVLRAMAVVGSCSCCCWWCCCCSRNCVIAVVLVAELFSYSCHRTCCCTHRASCCLHFCRRSHRQGGDYRPHRSSHLQILNNKNLLTHSITHFFRPGHRHYHCQPRRPHRHPCRRRAGEQDCHGQPPHRRPLKEKKRKKRGNRTAIALLPDVRFRIFCCCRR